MAACPVHAIDMEYTRGVFLPKIDGKACTRCGLCAKVCPGISFEALRFAGCKDDVTRTCGPVREALAAFAADERTRRSGSSGGVVSAMAEGLLDAGAYDAAFVLVGHGGPEAPARLKAETVAANIVRAAGSKYVPASVGAVIRELKCHEDGRFVVVCTACQLEGLRRFLDETGRARERLLFLGLFCGMTMNYHILSYFEHRYARRREKLVKLVFRSKEVTGWPGSQRLVFDSGRVRNIERRERTEVRDFFQLRRCLFCLDKLNRQADISFGDCWIDGVFGSPGESHMLVRTEKGAEAMRRCSDRLVCRPVNTARLFAAHEVRGKLPTIRRAAALCAAAGLDTPVPADPGPALTAGERWGLHLGRRRALRTIRVLLAWRRLVAGCRRKLDGLRVGAIMGRAVLAGRTESSEQDRTRPGDRHILVCGGGLRNKGAQAMVFTVVDQVRRRWPNRRVVLLLTPEEAVEEREKQRYTFKCADWTLESALRAISTPRHVTVPDAGSDGTDARSLFEAADCMIDISGFTLSSQFKSVRPSLAYLANILVAKRFGLPVYVFPQSFGPFDYPILKRLVMLPLLRLTLRYPRAIFAREEEGARWLRPFAGRSVRVQPDIVLTSGGWDPAHIFAAAHPLREPTVAERAVGIMPSLRVAEHTGRPPLIAATQALAKLALEEGYEVCILCHAPEDTDICRLVAAGFRDEPRVRLLDDDLNAMEMRRTIARMSLVVSSRYHAVVHAYASGVPAVVLGWTGKYSSLLQSFGQTAYCCDCRSGVDERLATAALGEMLKNLDHETQRIARRLQDLRDRPGPFDELPVPHSRSDSRKVTRDV